MSVRWRLSPAVTSGGYSDIQSWGNFHSPKLSGTNLVSWSIQGLHILLPLRTGISSIYSKTLGCARLARLLICLSSDPAMKPPMATAVGVTKRLEGTSRYTRSDKKTLDISSLLKKFQTWLRFPTVHSFNWNEIGQRLKNKANTTMVRSRRSCRSSVIDDLDAGWVLRADE